jgi:TRAP-type C4-dicarboxylate transport system permease small subunit
VILALLMFLLCFGYPMIGGWMLFAKHWPLHAGLTTLAIALLPIAWLFTLPSEEVGAPGTGFLLMLLVVPIGISLLLIVAGVLVATLKYARRVRSH